MLMMPPAFTTKSGAYRIPRAASIRSAPIHAELVVGRADDGAALQHAGWTRRRTRRRARTGRGMSQGVDQRGVDHRSCSTPNSRASASARASKRSDTTTLGALGDEQAREVRADVTRHPARPPGGHAATRRRRARRAPRRIACTTPNAVTGDGSPEPPSASSTPVTQGVTSARPFMSSVVAPTSSAAR